QGANRERNGNALTLQLVPNISAHGVVGLIDPGVITHVEFDLIGHGVIGEIDQEHLYRRIGENVFGSLRSPPQRIFYAVGWHSVIDTHPDAHGVDLGGIMQINDLVTHHLVVRDIEINVVVRAKPGGTPVDLTHFAVGVANLQPVTDLIWPIDLDRYAANDSGKEILSSEPENDRNDAGACQQSFQLRLGVIAVTQDKQQNDQEDEAADYLTQKMRNRCLTFLFEV